MTNKQVAQLVVLTKKDKDKYFNKLYEKTYQMAYHTSFQILNNHDDVNDVIQESYLKVYQNIDKLTYEEAFNSWFKRICINQSIMHIRKSKPEELFQEELEVPEEIHETTSYYQQPDHAFYNKERQNIVLTLINKLPLQTKITIVLYYVEQYSVKEITELLKINEIAVKRRLSYGRELLKKEAICYEDKYQTKIYSLSLLSSLPFIFQSINLKPEIIPFKNTLPKKKLNSSISQMMLVSSIIVSSIVGYKTYQNKRIIQDNKPTITTKVTNEEINNQSINEEVETKSSIINLNTLQQMLSIEGARYLYDSNLNSDNFTTFLEITNINQTRLLKIDNIEHEVYYKTSYLLTFYLLIEDGNYFYTIVKNNTELSDPNIYQKLKENKIYE